MNDNENFPSITKKSFTCPHCKAFTHQTWYSLGVNRYVKGDQEDVPHILDAEELKKLMQDSSDDKLKKEFEYLYNKLKADKPFIDLFSGPSYFDSNFYGCYISQCYTCNDISIWVKDKIVYPSSKLDILPNKDMPEDVKALFNEASGVVDLSPRGAAALLRLALQHLCKHLGKTGKNIDKDIASLVSDGLDPIIQQSLDILRVIGNESVHPGEIDLNDNRDIAISLFEIINIVCDRMISTPNKIENIYNRLPPAKLEGINNRDKKNKPKEAWLCCINSV